MKPIVSIVIPSYNHAQYIENAVGSVLRQTLDHIELIVIDDGSQDDSSSRLAKIKDSRLQVISQENRGAHATINRGLKMARGKYLAILNSDDEYMPDRLALAVGELEQHADIDFVSSWIELIDGKGKTLGVKQGWANMLPWPITPPTMTLSPMDAFALNLLASNFISTTSNIVMRRELFEEVGEFRNLRFAHDWDFCLRAIKSHKALMLPKPLMKYRVHGHNTIRQDETGMIFEVCWVLAANLPIFRDKLQSACSAEIEDFAIWLTTSLQTFGNDRVFMMLTFLASLSDNKQDKGAWFDLLDTNNSLRMWCLEEIRKNSAHKSKNGKAVSALAKLAFWRSSDGKV